MTATRGSSNQADLAEVNKIMFNFARKLGQKIAIFGNVGKISAWHKMRDDMHARETGS